MKTLIVMLILTLCLTSCTSTAVRTEKWSLDMDRVLSKTDFDKADVVVDPNGTFHITFEKFSSDSQRAISLIEKFVVGGLVLKEGAGI